MVNSNVWCDVTYSPLTEIPRFYLKIIARNATPNKQSLHGQNISPLAYKHILGRYNKLRNPEFNVVILLMESYICM